MACGSKKGVAFGAAMVVAITYLSWYGIWAVVELFVLAILEAAGVFSNINSVFLWGIWVTDLIHITGASLLMVGSLRENAAISVSWIPVAWIAHVIQLTMVYLAAHDIAKAQAEEPVWVYIFVPWHVVLTIVLVCSTIAVIFFVKDLKKTPNPFDRDGPTQAAWEHAPAGHYPRQHGQQDPNTADHLAALSYGTLNPYHTQPQANEYPAQPQTVAANYPRQH